MTNSQLEIEELYSSLIQDCLRGNAKKSLSVVKEACDKQRINKTDDYSIATIARMIVEKGGPTEGAIRNKTGHRYRELITAYAKRYSKTSSKNKEANSNSWIDHIENAEHRWLTRNLAAQNKRLRAEINILKQGITLNIDMRPIPVGTTQNAQLSKYTTTELDTVKYFLTPQSQKVNRYHFDDKGKLVISDTGEALSDIRLRDALEKIVSLEN